MKLKIKRLSPLATIPTYAHPGDSGLDLTSTEDAYLHPGDRLLVGTGISIELPKGQEAQIRPRSGWAAAYGVTVLNAPATIDQGYTGEIKVLLINHGIQAFSIKKGTKIAQMVIAPVSRVQVEEVGELAPTERGEDGFGSTGLQVEVLGSK